MKIVQKGSQEYLGDAVANKHLGKCVKCVLTDIQGNKSKSIMETQSGKCVVIISLLFRKNRAIK